MTALADRLAARTLELVDIHSESLQEHAIRQHLLGLVPPTLHAEWIGDEAALFVPDRRPGVPLVVLAGHYDTVPAQGNIPGRIADGTVHGLGASDMKGGLAVALELVRDLSETDRARSTSRSSSSAARSSAPSTILSRRSSPARRRSATPPSRSSSSRPTAGSRRAASGTSSPTSPSAGGAATPPGPGSPTTRSSARSKASRPCSRSTPGRC